MPFFKNITNDIGSNQPGTSNQEIELYQAYPSSSYTESINACGCGLIKNVRVKLYHSKFSAKLS